MGKFLFPDEYYDSTYSINFKKYYKAGYRGVLFDIDNTLVIRLQDLRYASFPTMMKNELKALPTASVSNMYIKQASLFQKDIQPEWKSSVQMYQIHSS